MTKAAVSWAGVGLAPVLVGLYDLTTCSYHPSGDAGRGGPFGFVFLLWRVPIPVLSGAFPLYRFAPEPSRDGTDD